MEFSFFSSIFSGLTSLGLKVCFVSYHYFPLKSRFDVSVLYATNCFVKNSYLVEVVY